MANRLVQPARLFVRVDVRLDAEGVGPWQPNTPSPPHRHPTTSRQAQPGPDDVLRMRRCALAHLPRTVMSMRIVPAPGVIVRSIAPLLNTRNTHVVRACG
jgi:hypothetical protein